VKARGVAIESDGVATLQDEPGVGFEQLAVFSEVFGSLLN
jgi:hypothetical protein